MSKKNTPDKINYPVNVVMTRQEFTVLERRLLYLALRNINQGMGVQKNLFDKGFVLTIPYAALKESNWNEVKRAVKKLEKRTIVLADDDERYEAFNIIWKTEARKDDALRVHFTPDMSRALSELSKGYAQLQFQLAMTLNSEYSQRMYELLSRWADVGVWFDVEISKLRELLNVPSSYNSQKLKERILNHAQKELKEKTNIHFTYELKKTGRRYTHIDFFIDDVKMQQQKEIFNENDLNDRTRRALEELKKIGIVRKDLQEKIINNHLDDFYKWLYQWKTMPPKNRNAIKNPAGYLLKSLGIL